MPPIQLTVQLTAILEGAYDPETELMRTTLQANGLVPLRHPYNAAPWNYNGSEAFPTLEDIPENMVDWVLLEVRDGTDNSIVIAKKAAVLLNDGSIVEAMGVGNGVVFPNLTEGDSYSIVVRHRNHLAVVSAVAIPVIAATLVYDFTSSIEQALSYSTAQLTEVAPDRFGLLAGDFDSDGVISVSDYNLFALQSAATFKYLAGDANLDKVVTTEDFNFYAVHSSVIGVGVVRLD